MVWLSNTNTTLWNRHPVEMSQVVLGSQNLYSNNEYKFFKS